MRFRCYNCPVGPHMPGEFHEFEGNGPLSPCPKCGAMMGRVVRLVELHFMAPDSKGPHLGDSGLRYSVACDPKRPYLAKNMADVYWAATGDPREVNCPSCRGTPAWKEAVMKDFPGHLEELAIKQAMLDIQKACCG